MHFVALRRIKIWLEEPLTRIKWIDQVKSHTGSGIIMGQQEVYHSRKYNNNLTKRILETEENE